VHLHNECAPAAAMLLSSGRDEKSYASFSSDRYDKPALVIAPAHHCNGEEGGREEGVDGVAFMLGS